MSITAPLHLSGVRRSKLWRWWTFPKLSICIHGNTWLVTVHIRPVPPCCSHGTKRSPTVGLERSFSWPSLLIFPLWCHLAGPQELTSANKHQQRHRPLSPPDAQGLGQANRRELSSAEKALASLPPSLHFLNEAESLALCWDMSHK